MSSGSSWTLELSLGLVLQAPGLGGWELLGTCEYLIASIIVRCLSLGLGLSISPVLLEGTCLEPCPECKSGLVSVVVILVSSPEESLVEVQSQK